MTEQELAEIERSLAQGILRPEDLRLLIHTVRSQQKQLDEVQKILNDLLERKRH